MNIVSRKAVGPPSGWGGLDKAPQNHSLEGNSPRALKISLESTDQIQEKVTRRDSYDRYAVSTRPPSGNDEACQETTFQK